MKNNTIVNNVDILIKNIPLTQAELIQHFVKVTAPTLEVKIIYKID